MYAEVVQIITSQPGDLALLMARTIVSNIIAYLVPVHTIYNA